MKFGQLLGQQLERLHLGLRLERFDLHGAFRLHDLLIGGGLRQADVARHLVVRGVDGRQRRLHFRRRIDAGDQRRVQDHAVARGGGLALLIHVLVQVAQVLAQIVDGNADHLAAGIGASAAAA